MNEIDILSQRKYAQELGFEEGRLAGEQVGREEMARNTAIKLLAAGISPEIIASCTGLPIKDVAALQ